MINILFSLCDGYLFLVNSADQVYTEEMICVHKVIQECGKFNLWWPCVYALSHWKRKCTVKKLVFRMIVTIIYNKLGKKWGEQKKKILLIHPLENINMHKESINNHCTHLKRQIFVYSYEYLLKTDRNYVLLFIYKNKHGSSIRIRRVK